MKNNLSSQLQLNTFVSLFTHITKKITSILLQSESPLSIAIVLSFFCSGIVFGMTNTVYAEEVSDTDNLEYRLNNLLPENEYAPSESVEVLPTPTTPTTATDQTTFLPSNNPNTSPIVQIPTNSLDIPVADTPILPTPIDQPPLVDTPSVTLSIVCNPLQNIYGQVFTISYFNRTGKRIDLTQSIVTLEGIDLKPYSLTLFSIASLDVSPNFDYLLTHSHLDSPTPLGPVSYLQSGEQTAMTIVTSINSSIRWSIAYISGSNTTTVASYSQESQSCLSQSSQPEPSAEPVVDTTQPPSPTEPKPSPQTPPSIISPKMPRFVIIDSPVTPVVDSDKELPFDDSIIPSMDKIVNPIPGSSVILNTNRTPSLLYLDQPSNKPYSKQDEPFLIINTINSVFGYYLSVFK